ncbi:MAG TPA: hydrolase [Micromonosporaceae bacterium]|nr:hydrolase [Micromonosporaceae bacterium]
MRIPAIALPLAAATVFVAAVGAPLPASAAPAVDVVLTLPAPTGRYPVGVDTVHLRDENRADPWVPERRRELMTSVWYPSVGGTGGPARYVSLDESRLILRQLRATELPPEILSATEVHARAVARPHSRPGGWPLVVLSPGFSFPRSSLTSLAEDLASRGYVVVGVDHTYEAAAVTFPDGRITDCLVCRMFEAGDAAPADVAIGRAADVSFVLDELTSRNTPWRAGRTMIDARRIAMAGHSLGGASAATTMVADHRVDAGVNMDGTFFAPVTRLDRPFLMLGAEGHGEPGNDRTWDETWSRLAGWRRWISVDGTTHSSFTDYGVLGDQVAMPLQPMAGLRSAEITRSHVAAFVDRHLRHRPAPLLHEPSTRYPEVRFWP